MTANGKNVELVLALNYGGRDEIVRATRKIIKAGVRPEDLDETDLKFRGLLGAVSDLDEEKKQKLLVRMTTLDKSTDMRLEGDHSVAFEFRRALQNYETLEKRSS